MEKGGSPLYYPYVMHHTRPPARIITVTGSGQIEKEPDFIKIQLEVVTENMMASAALQENAERMNRVIEALQQSGIPKSNIQTTSFTINPRYDYVDGQQIFRGYTVTNSISVKVPNGMDAGHIIDTAVQHGVNQISSLQYGIEHENLLYEQALQKALKQAVSKARALAETIQVQLDPKPIKITEDPAYQPGRPEPLLAVSKIASTPIEPGQIVVQASVRVQFQY
ncbi:SIMPL domain-containing protein [Sporosarcina sp. Te-1]|uniref:SIMPL domain-containing protein n=1 Tax=Sporosarcina sp. Te-1 TaxID=2818390 RepID=UPI001A9FE07E|nr:SIMPL domain-containing protein [Sporosarcina sp. Te-1]QTD42575.1 SIMPL domain-containing protein [Sporosarcina sp. Te-1]